MPSRAFVNPMWSVSEAKRPTIPLYQAVSERRRLAGMENWLPLFEEELGSIFDLFSGDDIVIADEGCVAARRRTLRSH